MKGDYIREMKCGEAVSLRGVLAAKDGDRVRVRFPEINASVWVWERNCHQEFFVRSAPPEVRWSYNALKHAAEKQKERLEAAENLLHAIRYNLEHLQVDLEGLALKAMRHTTSLSDMCEDMLADKLGGGYSTNCCRNVGNANKVAAGCLEALGTIRLIMHHFEEGQKTAAKEGGTE